MVKGSLQAEVVAGRGGEREMGPDEHDPLGQDDAWLATDAVGHVAIFTNAGPGPIPIACWPIAGPRTKPSR
jgi:hypothetical protein